jgi:uncharacterized membrane protein
MPGSAGEAIGPAEMQMMGMMGGAGDGGDAAPLRGHGFLLDGDVFTTIDHPDAVDETAMLGINSRGQILGGYVDAEGTVRGFLLDDGVFTPIDHPDAGAGAGIGTLALGLNDRGQIVGAYVDADGRGHGFLRDKGLGARDKGVFATIDHPDAGSEPATGTLAFGINNRGRIVGAYLDAGSMAHGFVRDKGRGARRDEGVFTTIDFPGAPSTLALAINNRDQISGASIDSENTKHGFLLQDGEFTAIDHPDAVAETVALGINDPGQIVGAYTDADGTGHGFLLDRDVFTTIDHPDAASGRGAGTLAFGLNDRGEIVGFYSDAQGAVHAFLLNKRFGSLREGVFTTIDHPDAASAPGLGTAAFGINDRGRIVGTYIDAGGRAHGFLRDKDHGALREKGAFTAIDHPDGALATVASGINNRGQIVGQYIDTDLRCHGLLLTNDTFTTIDDPGALSYTGAVDVNDRGQIVGFSDSRTGLTACFAEASTSASDPGSTDK